MADITHNDPVVTESKLTEFYNDIKPFLGCPAYVTQEGDAEYYSTDEKVIGRWVDGKPIYQKTLVLNVSDLTGSWPFKYYSLNSYGIDKPVSIQGLHKVDSDWYKTPDIELASSGFNSNYSVSMTFRNTTSNNQILICAQSSVHSTLTDFIITIQYTKLADSATTTIEQKPTHYSTDEQAVGIWLNNKTIWQKTVPVNVSMDFLHNKIILEKREFYKGINQDYVTYIYADADMITSHPFVQSNPTDMVFTYNSTGTTDVVLYQYVLTETSGIDMDIWYNVNPAKYTVNSNTQLTIDKSAGFMNTAERAGMLQPLKLVYTQNGVEKAIYGGFYNQA